MNGESSNKNVNLARHCEGCGIALDADSADTHCPACKAASQQVTAISAEQPPRHDSQHGTGEDAESKTEAFRSTPSPEGDEETPPATECLPANEPESDSDLTAVPSEDQGQPPERNVTVDFPTPGKEHADEGATSAHMPEGFSDALSDDDTRTLQRRLDFLTATDNPDILGMLDKYEITGVIGRGGMGIVLSGYDPALERVVAIKVLARELATNSTARKRFVREGQTAASVQHENVVGIYSVEPGEKLPFLVMKYIDGPSLLDKLETSGPLEVEQIVRVGCEVAMGLAAAHAKNLVHRDIKPSNILLENPNEHARITDFGLARAIDDVHITQTGVLAGTPQFMSPEQARAETIDHRSDLFSLGCVLYACCTGRSPFRAKTPLAAVRRVCKDTPRPIRDVNPDIPEWLLEIIDKLLEKNADDRFQTATELSELLAQHLAHLREPEKEMRPARLYRPKRRSRRRVLIVAAILVMLLGTPLIYFSDIFTSSGDQKVTMSSSENGLEKEKPPIAPPKVKPNVVKNRPQPNVQDERAKLQGEWAIESLMIDGNVRKTIPINRPQVKVQNDTWAQIKRKFKYDIDVSNHPKRLDFIDGKAVWRGIYQFKFGKLYIARAQDARGKRPKDFSGKTGMLIVMSRWEELPAAEKAKPWFTRANQLTIKGKWKEALVAFQKGLGLDASDSMQWIHCAPLLLESGDIEAYKEHCRKMLQQFGETKPQHAGRIAQICDLLPDCGISPATVEKLSKLGLESQLNRSVAYGITLFRLAKYEEACAQIENHLDTAPAYLKVRAMPVLAMARAQQGDHTKAYQALGEAQTLLQSNLEGVNRANKLMAEILLREAKAKIPPISSSITLAGTLTQQDPSVHRNNATYYRKFYLINLVKDVPYLFDLDGDFDTYLYVNDANSANTVYSDDVWFPNLNSRIAFTPSRTGFHELIVTSFSANDTGRFTLSVQKLPRQSEPIVFKGKLAKQEEVATVLPYTKNAYFAKRLIGLHQISLSEKDATTITLESSDFNTQLLVLDTKGVRYFTTSMDTQTLLPAAPSHLRRWTKPVKLSDVVNSGLKQWAPHLSKDGLTLLYTSNRAGGKGGYDLWQCTRKTLQDPWSEPVNLGPLINDSGREDHAHMSEDGLTLYFDSDRPSGNGKRDLWKATRKSIDQPWNKPVNLGNLVNSPHTEEGACLSADGNTLLFASDRPGGEGKHDLWMCRRKSASDPWSKPEPLGQTINSPAADHAPFLSHDGLTLLFQSERSGQHQIWKSTRKSVKEPWSPPIQLSLQLGPENRFSEGSPWLSADGETMYYHSTSTFGVSYLWMTRRVTEKEANATITPSRSQVTVTPMKRGKYYVLVTSAKEDRQGSYRLTIESYDAPAPKPSVTTWLNRARSDAKKIDMTTWRNVIKSYSHISNAGKSYSYAIQLSPQNALLHRERGRFYAQHSMWKEATADLDKSYQLERNDFQTWRQLLAILLATGKTKQFYNLVDEGIDRFTKQLANGNAGWEWTKPVNLGKTINTSKWDSGPCLSSDGLTLYFQSDRPGGLGKLDIWMSERKSNDSNWGTPVLVGGDVNSAADERGPYISADGLTLLFTSNRNGVYDVWQCTRKSAKSPWSKASNLGPSVNSSAHEQYPSLSADGLTLLFSSNREGGFGKSDLWICTRKTQAAPWKPAVNLRTLNSEHHESAPILLSDGLTLLFTSTRPGGLGQWTIWMSTRDTKDSPWSQPVSLGPTINSTSYDGCPTLSADGNELIFHSGRQPGEGFGDLWMSRRVIRATTLQKLILASIIVPEPDAKPLARIKKLSDLFEKQPTKLQNSRWSTLVRSALAYHDGRTEDAQKLVQKVIGAETDKNYDSAQLDLFSAVLFYRLGDRKTGSAALKRGRERLNLLQAKMGGNPNWVDNLYSDWLRGKAQKFAVARINEAIAKEGKNADLLQERALMLVYLGRLDEAAQDVVAVLRKDPARRAKLDVPADARLALATVLVQLRSRKGMSLTKSENVALEKEASRLLVLALADRNAAIQPDHERIIRSLEEPICQELLANHFDEKLAATRFASVLSSWKLLTPTALKSLQGATLTLQVDGSIVASGATPDKDSYIIEGNTNFEKLTGIRLEIIPDPSLPSKGVGRGKNGNICLTELTARFSPKGENKPQSINFKDADASYVRPIAADTSALDRPQAVIDGKHDCHWDVYPRMQSQHNLVVSIDPVQVGQGKLAVELHFLDHKWNQHTLARFRLWVTDAPNPLAALREVSASGWQSLAWIYIARGHPKRALAILEKLNPSGDFPASALIQLAIAKKMLGNDEGAKADYERAIKRWKTEPASPTTDSLARHASREVAEIAQSEIDWLISEQRSLPKLNATVEKTPEKVRVWRDRGGFYAWHGKWKEAAGDYYKAVDLASVEASAGYHRQRSKVTEELSQWPEVFAELAKRRPNDAEMWFGHGRYHILRSQWNEALAAYNKAKTIRPLNVQAEEAYEYAALLLLVGDLEEYRRFVRETAKNFEIRTNLDAYVMARMASLAPRALEDPGRAVQWGEKASERKVRYFLHAAGLAYYRVGQCAKAIEAFSESLELRWVPALNYFGLALANFRLERPKIAEQWLDKARQAYDAAKPGPFRLTADMYVTDWLEAEILRREVETLIRTRRIRTRAAVIAGFITSGVPHPLTRLTIAAEITRSIAEMNK